jgi:hypothetical protein
MSRMMLFGTVVSMLTSTLLIFAFGALWERPRAYWWLIPFVLVFVLIAVARNRENARQKKRQIELAEARHVADAIRAFDDAMHRSRDVLKGRAASAKLVSRF